MTLSVQYIEVHNHWHTVSFVSDKIYKCIPPKLGYAGISDFQTSDTHWKGGIRQRVHPYFCSNVDNGGVVEKITVLFLSYNASQKPRNK